MSNKRKIFNDPVYGFFSFPHDVLYDLIDHPYFQRLRRIKQMGFSEYIYPGAVHTRFHHALGALHLMTQAIDVLRSKAVDISTAESEAVCIAILLHDIGHGPYSHALEGKLIAVHHEELSVMIMQKLNQEFNGKLDLALQIFQNKYSKKYLYQLVSGQLDMDRMDYLNRDSYFTGVAEGVIGYERIIKMLNVINNQLVVEEKGIYSIEKFLMARRIMYWQVYLHKTSIAIEKMLVLFFKLLKENFEELDKSRFSAPLTYIIENSNTNTTQSSIQNGQDLLENYLNLDDIDIMSAIKYCEKCNIRLLAYVASGILNRNLFKIKMSKTEFASDLIVDIRQKIVSILGYSPTQSEQLTILGYETNQAYSASKNEILIQMKTEDVKGLSEVTDFHLDDNIIVKHYFVYPKNL